MCCSAPTITISPVKPPERSVSAALVPANEAPTITIFCTFTDYEHTPCLPCLQNSYSYTFFRTRFLKGVYNGNERELRGELNILRVDVERLRIDVDRLDRKLNMVIGFGLTFGLALLALQVQIMLSIASL